MDNLSRCLPLVVVIFLSSLRWSVVYHHSEEQQLERMHESEERINAHQVRQIMLSLEISGVKRRGNNGITGNIQTRKLVVPHLGLPLMILTRRAYRNSQPLIQAYLDTKFRAHYFLTVPQTTCTETFRICPHSHAWTDPHRISIDLVLPDLMNYFARLHELSGLRV